MAQGSRIRLALSLLALTGVFIGIARWRSAPAESRGTLFYYSLHFEAGTLDSQSIRSIDLTSGRDRHVSAKGLCGESSYAVDPSGRLIAACRYDGSFSDNGFSILDLATGHERRIASQAGRFPGGWTSNGALLLIDQLESRHGVSALEGLDEPPDGRRDTLRTRPLYTTDRSVGGVAGLARDTIAVMQCVSGGCHGAELVLVRRGHVLATIKDSAGPVIAFDAGARLLYMHGRQAPELRVLRLDGGGFDFEKTGIHGVFANADGGGAVVAPDGRIALAGDRISVLDPRTYELHDVAPGHGPLAWTPDGSIVYGGEDGKSIHMNDLRGHDRVLVRGGDVRAIAVL